MGLKKGVKMRKFIFYILLLGFTFSQNVLSGYLNSTEASFCMDECGMFFIELEYDSNSAQNQIPVILNDEVDLDVYLGRFVEVRVNDEEVNCIECSAFQVLDINLSQDCNLPVSCFADPCSVAEECLLNTPVDCISNYCGGCYADFYDLDNNLVDCYESEDDEGEEDIECSDIDNPFECYAVGCNWEQSNNIPGGGSCFEADADGEGDEGEDEDYYCEGLSQDECFLTEGCQWYENEGCYRSEEDNDLEDECRYFQSQEECLEAGCEWGDEDGCYGSWEDDEGEEDIECSDIDNPFECYAVGCNWEQSNNIPGGGSCFEADADGEEDESDNEESDGPPECLLDCEGIEFINSDQNPYETCDWIISNFGPNNFFNECAEDCSDETLIEINEYMEICIECLSDNNCDEIFDDENEQDSDCSDFTNEEECRVNDCDWQLNPTGVGQCIDFNDFDSVCEDLSDYFFGYCEMIIGIAWNGEECTWYSGCSTFDQSGVDHSGSFFDSVEECQAVCTDSQQDGGVLNGFVEYVWGDAIELVSGSLVEIQDSNGNFTYSTFTNDQGFYEIQIPQGAYVVTAHAYNEVQVQDVYVIASQNNELNFTFGEFDGGPGYGYAALNLENVVASPGAEVSVPLFLESDLPVAGVQFSVYALGEGSIQYLYPSELISMNDCFTANFNQFNGTFVGIIFSLEGCTYPSNESIHIADLVYEISDNPPSGSEILLEFETTLVSDSNGNEILSYGQGSSVLLGLVGDVNSDSQINILDVVLMVSFAIYIEEPSDAQFWASDINLDNSINVLDVVQIVNLILDN